jgi:hypothetical protein
MSLKWFCFKKEGLNPVIKIAAFDAGYLVEKNNKGFYAQARPVIDGILHADVSEEVMNVVFHDAIETLLEKVKDPMVTANILAVLALVEFHPTIPNAPIPMLPKEHIKDLVTSFAEGAKLVQ